MINNVLQTIERYESSSSFDQSQLPVDIFDAGDEQGTTVLSDIEEESSNDSIEFLDIKINNHNETVKQTDQILIKQTLKDKIRIRRESEGAAEIKNLFEPPKTYELTPEEETKNEIRKQRNRQSANKSRLKRIAREKQLEKDAEELEKEHTRRTSEVNALKKYKEILVTYLKHHLRTCPKSSVARSTVAQSYASLTSTAQTISCGTNKASSLENQLLTALIAQITKGSRDPQTSHHVSPSAQINVPLKRKAADEENDRPFKMPRTWSLPQIGSVHSNPTSMAEQTCTNDNLMKTWTGHTTPTTSEMDRNNGNQSVSIATEMGIQCSTINKIGQNKMMSTNGQIPSRLLVSPLSRNGSVERPVSINVFEKIGGDKTIDNTIITKDETELQRINLIKQHLLDDFCQQSSS